MSFLISTALDIAGFAVVVVTGFAICIAYSEIRERFKVYRTRNWIRARASVENIRQRPAQEVSRIQTDAWAIEFDYNYEVNGNSYSKQDRMIWRWEKVATNVARGLATEGMSIRFDPDDPASSVFYLDEIYGEFNKP